MGYPRNRLRTPLALRNRFDKFAGSELFAIKNRSFFNQSPTLPIPTGKCPISGTEISGSASGTTPSNTPTLEFACFSRFFCQICPVSRQITPNFIAHSPAPIAANSGFPCQIRPVPPLSPAFPVHQKTRQKSLKLPCFLAILSSKSGKHPRPQPPETACSVKN